MEFYTFSDLVSTYNQVPITEETKKTDKVCSCWKKFMFEQGFQGLCGLPNFFSNSMTTHFAEVIARKQALASIDIAILQANTKQDMWNNIVSYFKCFR